MVAGLVSCPCCHGVVDATECALLAHAFTCKRVAHSKRHEIVKKALVNFWRSYSIDMDNGEPKIITFFPAKEFAPTASEEKRELVQNRRGDILVRLKRNGGFYMLDTVVTAPHTSRTAAPLAAGTAARAAELKKHASYERDFQVTPGRFVPFALEVYGAWGEEASKFLRVIASNELEGRVGDIAKFERECAVFVSVALQREVAVQLQSFKTALAAQAVGAGGGL